MSLTFPKTLLSFQKLIGVTIGVILFAIGSITMLNAVAKLYIFGFETNPSFDPHRICTEKLVGIHLSKAERPYFANENLKNQAIETCVTERTNKEIQVYARGKNENIIDGFLMLLVGLGLWIYFNYFRIKFKDD